MELDPNIRPYLTALMIAAVAAVGEKLIVPADADIQRVTMDAFREHVAELANKSYDRYGALASLVPGLDTKTTSADVESILGTKAVEDKLKGLSEAMVDMNSMLRSIH